MPRISEFYGIVIYMYYSDHSPPHFHAQYGSSEAAVVIRSGEVLKGHLPSRALELVREWAAQHELELQDNWMRARAHEAVQKVRPLD